MWPKGIFKETNMSYPYIKSWLMECDLIVTKWINKMSTKYFILHLMLISKQTYIFVKYSDIIV